MYIEVFPWGRNWDFSGKFEFYFQLKGIFYILVWNTKRGFVGGGEIWNFNLINMCILKVVME